MELPFHPLATKGSILIVKTPYFDVGNFKVIEATLEVYSAYAPANAGGRQVDMETSADLDLWVGLLGFTLLTPPLPTVPFRDMLHLTEFLRYVRGSISVEGPNEPALFTFSLLGIARDHE